MRKCSKCLQELPLENFSRNASRKDGLNERCKECCNQYIRQHYQKNKQYYKDKAKKQDGKQYKILRQIITENKKQCSKCGEKHPATLDYHHLDKEQKSFTITQATGTKRCSVETLLKEIAKCIVLCSNCHRKLHWEEKYGTS